MRRRSAVRRLAIGAGLLAATSFLAACGGDDDGATALAGVVRNPPLEVAAVHLPDVRDGGAPVAMQAPAGELYLVYFGYTNCPDVCPTTLSDISVALGDLPEDLADRITVAMTTVDPERDTDAVLAGYLDHFFDDSLALRTTDAAALQEATDAFGVQWEIEAHDPGEAYDVGHTAVTYVIDDTGQVVVEWPFGFDSRSMTSDLTTLLRKDTT
jgi:protein SCO1/2